MNYDVISTRVELQIKSTSCLARSDGSGLICQYGLQSPDAPYHQQPGPLRFVLARLPVVPNQYKKLQIPTAPKCITLARKKECVFLFISKAVFPTLCHFVYICMPGFFLVG